MLQETKKGKKMQVEKEKMNKKEEKSEESTKKNSTESVKLKYGPTVRFPYQRVWSRSALIFPALFIVWYSSRQGKETYSAQERGILLNHKIDIECSDDYKTQISKYPDCIPEKCGRIVTDKLISATETDVLLNMAINGFNLDGSNEGASTLDLHSGVLSKDQGFVDIYTLPEAKQIFNSVNFAIYKAVKTKIHHAIAHNFGVPSDKIFLTKPTFLSRMNNLSEGTLHDAYWQPHSDKQTFEFYHYTSVLYLNDYRRDFKGGRLMFIDKTNKTIILPRKGRVSMFTSGKENLHSIERVESGTRYALTICFTCDPNGAISDPSYRMKQEK